jgi:hypothetical protein
MERFEVAVGWDNVLIVWGVLATSREAAVEQVVALMEGSSGVSFLGVVVPKEGENDWEVRARLRKEMLAEKEN